MPTGMRLSDDPGHELPTTVSSRERMMPNLPKVWAFLQARSATALAEMIFGEDAPKTEGN